MNILRIFGIVAAIHAFALLLIFANPGCSSSAAKQDQAPTAAAPAAPESSPMVSAPLPTGMAPLPASPDAAPAPTGSLYSPTRPGTAAAAALETQPVADVTPTTTYSVGRGDSLWSIAKKNHLRVSELAAANNLKSGATLHLGQKLLIPTKAVATLPAEAKAETPAPVAPAHVVAVPKTTGESVKYVVRPGETLGAIAHRFGVKMGDLAAKNAISDPKKIRPGQELIIPAGGKTASAKSSKSSAMNSASANGPTANPHSASPSAPAPAAGAEMNAAPAPAPEVPVIKIDAAPSASGPADQPKTP